MDNVVVFDNVEISGIRKGSNNELTSANELILVVYVNVDVYPITLLRLGDEERCRGSSSPCADNRHGLGGVIPWFSGVYCQRVAAAPKP